MGFFGGDGDHKQDGALSRRLLVRTAPTICSCSGQLSSLINTLIKMLNINDHTNDIANAISFRLIAPIDRLTK